MKKLFAVITSVLIILIAVVLFRGFNYFSDVQYQVKSPLAAVDVDSDKAVAHMSKAIQIRTISYDDPSLLDAEAFLAFHQHLQQSFPLVHERTQLTKVSDYSLLYFLPGSDASLKPALFMGHMDVVPVDEATADKWQQAPFSGAVVDNTIWGRGAIDDKVTVMALLESLELLLAEGLAPKRGIYFAFGHDEEIGGTAGAQKIAALLQQQNVELEFVLDEGGIIAEGLMAGVEQPVALIGVAEKGFVNFRLTVSSEGGHSSQPPEHTAVGILSQAIVNLEASSFDSDLRFTQQTFATVGAYADLGTRLPMANLWLLEPVVKQVLLSGASSAAGIRTTIAPTMLKGSSKSNILPTEAEAVVNFRIFPNDNIASIQAHIEKVVDDPRVKISSFMANEASTAAPTDSFGYRLIEQSIRRLDDSILVAPYLVLGGTDSKHFYPLSDNVYRFMMVRLNSDSLKRFHGVNEQIPVKDYLQAIQLYYALLKQTANGESLE
ncbi:M20 family peptidase [Alteromonadaceae bacterium BrNp21-10]|nr:M20 family peptidase [Alteromonadaceae bacterium BrNp21-10]